MLNGNSLTIEQDWINTVQDKPKINFEERDEYKRKYEHANTNLCFKAMRFRHQHVSPVTIDEFIEAVHTLAAVFKLPASEHHPLDTFFWARNKLQTEFEQEGRSDVFKVWCRRAINELELDIQAQCDLLGDGKIVALV
ncbi:hypothetical protein A3715_08370 [Oleiphilus sp. HI0009]|uniref:hypothetical protein n=1 Tax=unclassified Oleiphilus TaxID=2631174 RepID=UPI0007C29DE7|nr:MULTISPECIES: hypothetical protein [unclassified Oleiphilus]KZX79379.1 hypothetical protein A3715_08370 [Oleiphilus sp. HI0009]KZY63081.1 hypothetical protein A3738_02530 [Oleiphilus sp. HI0066]KZY69132.1 hypothetical protein A3739_09570 [Oleiphilus sp. HI0067]MCH2157423.1 hypothetical protein [Oleiphilaceae bacterium]